MVRLFLKNTSFQRSKQAFLNLFENVSSQFLALLQYHIKITLHLFLRATQIMNT